MRVAVFELGVGVGGLGGMGVGWGHGPARNGHTVAVALHNQAFFVHGWRAQPTQETLFVWSVKGQPGKEKALVLVHPLVPPTLLHTTPPPTPSPHLHGAPSLLPPPRLSFCGG